METVLWNCHVALCGVSSTDKNRDAVIELCFFKFAGICKELNLPVNMLTWDMDEDGDWAEPVKSIDDYLYGLEKQKQ